MYKSNSGLEITHSCLADGAFISSLAFTLDDNKLLIADGGGNISLWDVGSNKFLVQSRAAHHYEGDEPTLFVPLGDGQTALSTGGDSLLKFWKLDAALSLTKTVELPIDPVAIVVHPDKRHILFGGTGGEISIWDLWPEFHLIKTEVKHRHKDFVSMALNSQGTLLAATTLSDPFLLILDPLSLNEEHEPIPLSRGGGSGVEFSADDKTIVVSNTYETISLYDWNQTNTDQYVLEGINVPFVVSPDNTHITARLQLLNKAAILDRTRARSIARKFPVDSNSKIVSIILTTDGRNLAVLQEDGTITTVNFETGIRSTIAIPHDEPFYPPAVFSGNGDVLGAAFENRVCLYEMRHPDQPTCVEMGFRARVLAFDSKGTILAAGGWNGELVLLDRKTGQIRISSNLDRMRTEDVTASTKEESSPISVYSFAFRPDNQSLAVGGSDGQIDVLEIRGGQELQAVMHMVGHTNAVFGVCFDPNGRILTSTSSDGTIRFWDTYSDREIGLPIQTGGGAQELTCSADFSMIATTFGTSVRLYDTKKQIRIGDELPGPKASIYSFSMSQDGEILAASSQEEVLVWDLRSSELRARACKIASRNMTTGEWRQFVDDVIPCRRICPSNVALNACE
jgi:WD40 repeat protein